MKHQRLFLLTWTDVNEKLEPSGLELGPNKLKHLRCGTCGDRLLHQVDTNVYLFGFLTNDVRAASQFELGST